MENDFAPKKPHTAAPGPEGDRRFREVEMRCWPHPIEPAREEVPISPSLHYIHCALAYQNQTLADIKAMLQKLTQELE